MKKIIALVVMASLGTGCFTATGAVIGASKSKPAETNSQEDAGSYALEGAGIGAVLDVLLLTVLVGNTIKDGGGCFTYGPGEGKGPCGYQ
jgi:hypothetical protein